MLSTLEPNFGATGGADSKLLTADDDDDAENANGAEPILVVAGMLLVFLPNLKGVNVGFVSVG